MTVGGSSVSTIKPGRGADAIAMTKKWEAFLAGNGAKNVRSILLMDNTPMQIVLSWEAENNTEAGAFADKMMGDPAFQTMMHEVGAEDSPISASTTNNWIVI